MSLAWSLMKCCDSARSLAYPRYFTDKKDFSKSWDVEGEITEADYVELTDDISTYGED